MRCSHLAKFLVAGALIWYLSGTRTEKWPVPSSSPRQLAQKPSPSSTSEAENLNLEVNASQNRDLDVNASQKLLEQWRPFWSQSIRDLLHEGFEVVRNSKALDAQSRSSNVKETCEELLEQEKYVEAFSPWCQYELPESQRCFDIMDRGTSIWLLGSMLRDCIKDPTAWSQTWQACRQQMDLALPFEKMDLAGAEALQMACVRSCHDTSSSDCPQKFGPLGLQESKEDEEFGKRFIQCDRLLFNFTGYDRSRHSDPEVPLSEWISGGYCGADYAVPLCSFHFNVRGIEIASEVDKDARLTTRYHYDHFVYGDFCTTNDAGLNVTQPFFKKLDDDFQGDPNDIIRYFGWRWGLEVAGVLHRAIDQFLHYNDSSVPEVYPGWHGCQNIIDHGIQSASTDESDVQSCKDVCNANLHSAYWQLLVVPFLSRQWTLGTWQISGPLFLLFLLGCLVIVIIFRWILERCQSALDRMEDAEGPGGRGAQVCICLMMCFVVVVVGALMFSILMVSILTVILICAACVLLEFLLRIASGHGTAWVCLKTYLFWEAADVRWQYTAGAVGLMTATILGSCCYSSKASGASDSSDAGSAKSAVRHLLCAQFLCILLPCLAMLVLEKLGWMLPWYAMLPQYATDIEPYIAALCTFLLGLSVFLVSEWCLGHYPSDIMKAVQEMHGKGMVFDIFMDNSQAFGFYLMGQPYFALAQVSGVLGNGFMTIVAPKLEFSTLTRIMAVPSTIAALLFPILGAVLGAVLSGFGLIHFGPFGLAFGPPWLSPLESGFAVGGLIGVAYGLVVFLGPFLLITIAATRRNFREFLLAVVQADLFPLIWKCHGEPESQELLFKKAAEASGEGTLSLLVGLTALFKARLGNGSSSLLALFQLLANVLYTSYTLSEGLVKGELAQAADLCEHRIRTFAKKTSRAETFYQRCVVRFRGLFPIGDCVVKGRLIGEDRASRETYLRRRCEGLALLRASEVLATTVAFVLMASSFNFLKAGTFFCGCGAVFSVLSTLVLGNRFTWSLLLPFTPGQAPATMPTSGQFEVEIVSRLATSLLAWLAMLSAWPFGRGAYGFLEKVKQAATRHKSTGTAELWQAYIILLGISFGFLAWPICAWSTWKVIQNRQEWFAEDSARFSALAAIDPSMWTQDTTLSSLIGPDGAPIMEHLDSAEDDDDERSRMLDCLKFSEAEIEYVKTFQNSIRVHEPAGPPAPQAESSAIVYPQWQLALAEPLALEHGSSVELTQSIVGFQETEWTKILKQCPCLLPPQLSWHLLGSKAQPIMLKEFAGELEEGVSHFKIIIIGGQFMFGTGRWKDGKPRLGMRGSWSNTSTMSWTFFNLDTKSLEFEDILHALVNTEKEMVLKLQWSQLPGRSHGCVIGQEHIFHEISPKKPEQVEQVPTQAETRSFIYVPKGGRFLDGQALQTGRETSELREKFQLFDVQLLENSDQKPLPWALDPKDPWHFIHVKAKDWDQVPPEPGTCSCLCDWCFPTRLAGYSSLSQDPDSDDRTVQRMPND
ncbi:unnamed protein product [Durusdinium trenchii]|uniref:Uncharacterized protein n=1 Tax=Durusdinium trenchii TaxID=1381693 RepID=A0ABP0LNK1_9DINO